MFSCRHECINVLTLVFDAGRIECIVESKLLDLGKELLLIACLWLGIGGREKGEKRFKHAAGCTAGRHKFHDVVLACAVVLPLREIDFHCRAMQLHNAFANGRGSFEF